MAMRIFRALSAPPTRGDPATFAGTVSVQRLAEDDAAVPVAVYRVAFSGAGRTNWHSHSGPQWLFVIEGRIRVQRHGEPAQDVEAGDAVVIAPNEKHWHGAVPGATGTHIAVNINTKTTWMEPVSDEDYLAAGR